MKCDFCGRDITAGQVVKRRASEMHTAVNLGFNLHRSKYIDRSLLDGVESAALETVADMGKSDSPEVKQYLRIKMQRVE